MKYAFIPAFLLVSNLVQANIKPLLLNYQCQKELSKDSQWHELLYDDGGFHLNNHEQELYIAPNEMYYAYTINPPEEILQKMLEAGSFDHFNADVSFLVLPYARINIDFFPESSLLEITDELYVGGPFEDFYHLDLNWMFDTIEDHFDMSKVKTLKINLPNDNPNARIIRAMQMSKSSGNYQIPEWPLIVDEMAGRGFTKVLNIDEEYEDVIQNGQEVIKQYLSIAFGR